MTTARLEFPFERLLADWTFLGARQEPAEEALAYLRSALSLERSDLFLSYASWRAEFDAHRGEESAFLRELSALPSIGKQLPADLLPSWTRLVGTAIEALSGERKHPDPAPKPMHRAELATVFLEDLLAGRRREATERILREVDAGFFIDELYLDVFGPVLARLGELWERNEISVGQEHYCTAVIQSVMAQLFPRVFSGSPGGRTLVATSVLGNLHEIGVRMLSDLFEIEGWNTHYLGANVPAGDLVATAVDRGADAVAISAMMGSQLEATANAVRMLRDDPRTASCIVILGGRAFQDAGELASSMGADLWAPDAAGAIRLLDEAVPNP